MTDGQGRGARRGPAKRQRKQPEVFKSVDDCPWRDQHTPAPPGYIAWHSWASRMGSAHRQIRCKKCRLYAIWVVKGTNKRVTELIDPDQTCLTCPRTAHRARDGRAREGGE
jgi:hypothetical protein